MASRSFPVVLAAGVSVWLSVACGSESATDTGATTPGAGAAAGSAGSGGTGSSGGAGGSVAGAAGSVAGAGAAGAAGGAGAGPGGGSAGEAGAASTGGSGGATSSTCAAACNYLGECLTSLDLAGCEKACANELSGNGCLDAGVAAQLFDYIVSKIGTPACKLSTPLGIGWGFAYSSGFQTNDEALMMACEVAMVKQCGNATTKPQDNAEPCYTVMLRYNDSIRKAALACLTDQKGCGAAGICIDALPCQTGAPWIGVF